MAKARQITVPGNYSSSTPILVPSFSSKASPSESVKDVLRFAEGVLTDEVLISAYDVHYSKLPRRLTSPTLVFSDSGGYEASQDAPDLSENGTQSYRPKLWTQDLYYSVLEKWNLTTPTILVSFDHPRQRVPVGRQIERARKIFTRYEAAGSAILIKPSEKKSRQLNIDEIIEARHDLHGFTIIGLTEKELGESTLHRLKSIARIRKALVGVGLDTPIHVFGSLDTILTPLYFLAGADVFDGLTWLRYGFVDGNTVYRQACGALRLGIGTKDYRIATQLMNSNYYYIRDLQNQMRRSLATHEVSVFTHHSAFFRQSIDLLRAELEA